MTPENPITFLSRWMNEDETERINLGTNKRKKEKWREKKNEWKEEHENAS